MQNVIYAVIGVILTVAAMYMVAPSINSSSEAIKANLVATEVGAIKNAAKMWLANESTDGTYTSIANSDIENYLPELDINGSDFVSKAGGSIKHTVTSVDSGTKIQVSIAGLNTKQIKIVENALLKLGDLNSTTGATPVKVNF